MPRAQLRPLLVAVLLTVGTGIGVFAQEEQPPSTESTATADVPSPSPEPTLTPMSDPTPTPEPTPTPDVPTPTDEPTPSDEPKPSPSEPSKTDTPRGRPRPRAQPSPAVEDECEDCDDDEDDEDDDYGERDVASTDADSDVSSGSVDGEPEIVPIERTPPRNTVGLLEQLGCGLSARGAVIEGTGRFPVAGRAFYSDDWLNPRYSPSFHLHHGLDIFAASDTPIRAPVDATITRLSDNPHAGGIGVSMRDDAGTWYYFGHLLRRADGLRVGRRVLFGTTLGYVGDTGNARGGVPHLHLEIHEDGVPIPPKPIVDLWLDEAISDATNRCVVSGPDSSQPVPTMRAIPTTAPRPAMEAVSVANASRRDSDGPLGPFVIFGLTGLGAVRAYEVVRRQRAHRRRGEVRDLARLLETNRDL